MKLAFVFPGQGSQSLGMMQGFDALPVVRETFEEAGAVLKQDLWQLVTSGPLEALAGCFCRRNNRHVRSPAG